MGTLHSCVSGVSHVSGVRSQLLRSSPVNEHKGSRSCLLQVSNYQKRLTVAKTGVETIVPIFSSVPKPTRNHPSFSPVISSSPFQLKNNRLVSTTVKHSHEFHFWSDKKKKFPFLEGFIPLSHRRLQIKTTNSTASICSQKQIKYRNSSAFSREESQQ